MKTLTALVSLLSFASTALAETDASATSTATETGLYLGVGIGQFDIKAEDVDGAGPVGIEFDANDTSLKAFAGWRFGKYLAVELDYIDLGKPDEEVNGLDVKTQINGVAPYLVGTLPVGPLELFAKAGYLFYDLEVEVADEEVDSVSGNTDDFIYSLGVGVTLFDHLHTRIEYEVIDMSGVVTDAEAVWVSGAWRF